MPRAPTVSAQRGTCGLAEVVVTGVSSGFWDGSWQLCKSSSKISSRLSSSMEILAAATINIQEVPQGALPSFPLPWQGDSSAARDTSPGTAVLTAGSDVLQKRCHSPQPPCLADLSKSTRFISSTEPRLTRNAIFSTSSFTPKRLPKEQGNK